MKSSQNNNNLNEICDNCGSVRGSHLGVGYYSNSHKRSFPEGCCPGDRDNRDWGNGPGTTFKPTDRYKKTQNLLLDEDTYKAAVKQIATKLRDYDIIIKNYIKKNKNNL